MSVSRTGENYHAQASVIINPFRVADSDGRTVLSKEVAALYRSQQITDPTTVWNKALRSGLISTKSSDGLGKMHELLEIAKGVGADKARPVAPHEPTYEFFDPEVANFLFDIFSSDSRVTSLNYEERLSQIFFQIASDIFSESNYLGTAKKPPEVDRVRRVAAHFTIEPLPKAIEFFLIEPRLLPEVPNQRPDEK